VPPTEPSREDALLLLQATCLRLEALRIAVVELRAAAGPCVEQIRKAVRECAAARLDGSPGHPLPAALGRSGLRSSFESALGDDTASRARRATDRTIAGFVLSAADAAVLDLLRVSQLAGPLDWQPWIEGKAVRLGEAVERGLPALCEAELAAALRRLRVRPLRKKLRRLTALCPPADAPGGSADRAIEALEHIVEGGETSGDPRFPIEDPARAVHDLLVRHSEAVARRYGLALPAEDGSQGEAATGRW